MTTNRTRIFRIRVSDIEYDVLRSAAGQGREVSTWARKTLFACLKRGGGAGAPRFSTSDAHELIRALTPIGSNINQIARRLNSGDSVPTVEVVAAHAEVVTMLKRIAEDID